MDGTTVEFCVTMGSAAFGNYADFQRQEDSDDHYKEEINSCSKCHFSGYLFDFEIEYNEDEKNNIKKLLKRYHDVKVDEVLECQIAAEIKQRLKQNADHIANCYLIGTYIIKGNVKKDKYRKELQNKVRYYLIKAIKNKEYTNQTEIASINYLIGEMYRRTGHFRKAKSYYDIAINNPEKSPWVEEMAVIQKELAMKRNDNNRI
ncbi:DUF2225 domain-containing protein [Mariniflexile sp. HNIBRBA6329]|uniref:DUF2225 domain-containing protein n=1 Tax=Mariniflexile sp. HNIBRBA6329 TaxID=3373088 RepID=UPI003746DDBA